MNSPFEHPQEIQAPQDQTVRIERIIGYFPQVTSAPTWTPQNFKEQFAVDGSHNKLYIYDIANQGWRNLTLN